VNYRFAAILAAILLLAAPALASCGDNSCSETENECTCPSDCGTCARDAPGYGNCKAFACANNACILYTKDNCCGNEVCELGEDYGNCPADCLPTELDVLIQSPDFADYFVKGESVLLKAKITAHGRKAILADAKAFSPLFGTIQIFNDGKHDDDSAFDDIFANHFIIPFDAAPGLHPLNLDVNFQGVSHTDEFEFLVDPKLDVVIYTRDQYLLGETIDLSSEIYRKGELAPIPLDVNLVDEDGGLLFQEHFEPLDGLYGASFPTTLLEPEGVWTLTIAGEDEHGNQAFLEKSIEFFHPGIDHFLTVEVLEPTQKNFKRGENIPLLIRVISPNGQPINDASLFLDLPGDKNIAFTFTAPGLYSADFDLPFTFPQGRQSLQVEARQESGLVDLIGARRFDLNVSPVSFNFTFNKPDSPVFKSGEEIIFDLEIEYPDGSLARTAKASVSAADEKIDLEEVAIGRHHGRLPLTGFTEGKHTALVEATDAFGNHTSQEFAFEISGETLLAGLQERAPLLLALLAAVLVAFIYTRHFLSYKHRLASLKKKEKKIISLEKDLQKRYFNKAEVPKQEFKEASKDIARQLDETREKIKGLKK
jgi:hypothetical protein